MGVRHPRSQTSLFRWVILSKKALWRNFEDVKATFPSVDRVKVASGRLCFIFDIGGNEFRLIGAIHFSKTGGNGRIYILKLLTHAEYDRQKWKEEL